MTTLKNITLAAAALIAFSAAASAQTATTQAIQASYAEPFTVKYLGVEGEYLLFQVNAQTSTPRNSSFTVVDKKEGALYTTNLRNPFTQQTIKIEKTSQQLLDFKLVVGKNIYKKSFSVNTNQVDNTVVAEGDVTIL